MITSKETFFDARIIDLQRMEDILSKRVYQADYVESRLALIDESEAEEETAANKRQEMVAIAGGISGAVATYQSAPEDQKASALSQLFDYCDGVVDSIGMAGFQFAISLLPPANQRNVDEALDGFQGLASSVIWSSELV